MLRGTIVSAIHLAISPQRNDEKFHFSPGNWSGEAIFHRQVKKNFPMKILF